MPSIGELLSRRSEQVVPGASLRDVAACMLGSNISSVIVVDQGVALGIITEHDMLRIVRQHLPLSTCAQQVMTRPLHSVPHDSDFCQAYRQAIRLGIRHMLVVDDAGAPLGVVSESDFRRHLGPDFFQPLNNVDSLMDRSFPHLPANARLDEALTAMAAIHGSCTLVVDGRRPLGIVTERDVVRLYLQGDSERPIGEVMSQPIIQVSGDCAISEAARLMLEHEIRHLVVIDQQALVVGILSEHALMRPFNVCLVDEFIEDRQQQRHNEQALAEKTARNERYQRALLDNFPFPVWLKDTESRLLTSNVALAKYLGQETVDAMVGKTDHELWPRELAQRYRNDDLAVMASRQKLSVVELVSINGQTVWHETYKAPIIGEDGALLGTVGFAHDISDRKRAEDAALLRKQALTAMISGTSLSEALALIARSVEAELPGFTCTIALADTVAASPPSARLASPILGPEGQLQGYVCAQPSPGTPPNEESERLLNQASQLATLLIEHQQRTDALHRSLETFHDIFDNVSEALFVQATDGRFLDVSVGAERLLGYPRAQLLGQTHAFLLVPELNDLANIDRQIAAALAGKPQVLSVQLKNSEDYHFPAEVRLHASHYFGQPAIIASVSDISERRNAALRLEIEHDLAQALAAGLPREQVLGALLRATLRIPEINAGTIHWQRADGGFDLLAQEGLSNTLISKLNKLAPNDPLTVFAQNGGMICNCHYADADCSDPGELTTALLADLGMGCLIAVPILLNGQTVACLTLVVREHLRISPWTMQALAGLGTYFSQALQLLASQEAGRRLQQNWTGLFDTLQDFIFIADTSGCILHYNRSVAERLGYGAEQLKGTSIATVYSKNQAKTETDLLADILAGRRFKAAQPLRHADGRLISVESRFSPGDWDGQPALICIAQDISERLAAEERQQLAASVFDNAHEGIMITDADGRIVEVNATFSELTGYSREEALGKSPELLKSGHHPPEFYEVMWQKIRKDDFWRGEIWNRKKSGEIFVELLNISAVRHRDGTIANFVAIFSDITLIKQHQQRLEHLAHYDALTQLPNRMLLSDRMRLAMAHSDRSGKPVAVCYLDLDNFKPVNDEFGHAAGDGLLIEVARRLKSCMRAGDTVSRLGGDEFVLLIADIDNLHECERAINRVIGALSHPFRISAHDVSISASIGVTLYPQDGADADTLLRHADQAMYAAKQCGRNRYHLFDPENDRRARDRRDSSKRIGEALANGEFLLYYQPKVDMRQGHVIGSEALIRWQHPERGLLLPESFLPVIEGSELAVELGDWVVQEVFAQISRWHEQGINLPVSINISGEHLQHPGFSARLGELLALHPEVHPAQIELEILETAVLEDVTSIAELFSECRRLGVSFSLDDFGTGYSSLTYFRRLPAETLKIDQSFIRNMLEDPNDLAIVEGVIGLTRAFKRQVIAEGVETVEHGLVLLLLGCDKAQGFGIARPMPAAAIPAWIRNFEPDELWNLATSFQWSREDLPMLIAQVEHRRWTKALIAHLEDANGTVPAPPMDEQNCGFGRWYYNPENQRHHALESFKSLEPLHDRLHEIGRLMLERQQAGDTAALASLKSELEQLNNRFAESIQQIQAEALFDQ